MRSIRRGVAAVWARRAVTTLAVSDRESTTAGNHEQEKLPSANPLFDSALLACRCPVGLTQNGFRVLTGSGLKYAIPHEFYLEGNAVPVDSRNAVLIETSSGVRVLVALVVTSGWASQLPHKYSGDFDFRGGIVALW